MTDYNNYNRPNLPHSGIRPGSDGSKKHNGAAPANETRQPATPNPSSASPTDPEGVFAALKFQGTGIVDRITQARIEESLAGLPSPERFALFEAIIESEFPRYFSPLQKSDMYLARYFGEPQIVGS